MTLLIIISTALVTFLITRQYPKPQTLSAKKLLKDGKYYQLIDKYRSEGNKEPFLIYSFQEISIKDKFKTKGEIFFVSSLEHRIAFTHGDIIKNGEVYEASFNWTGVVILKQRRF